MQFDALRLLLEYHYWARDRALAAAEALTADEYSRALGNSFGSIRDTLTHIYFADWVWYCRFTGHSPTAGPSSDLFPDVAALRAAWTDLEARTRALLDELGPDGIERVIDYRMLSGDAQSSVIWHLVQHLVNHGTYHRGQVTTMLRQLGAAPPAPMDLIVFYRERAG